ncbi:MAG TPA: efflux RND transporter permease subunit [Acidiferrobacterales bacterium]|nr:efflux RND transporter permease subunit [Acidiferrobacterales bacterium]
MKQKNQANQEHNIAGRVANYFVDSKLTILIILVALLTGGMAILSTPREENPQIVVPAANIIVSKPGASPEEIQQLIVKPLEAILQGLKGVEHTYGMAMDSMGVVSVQFAVGQNMEDSLVKLYDRIMSNIDRLPPGTRQPLVKPVDVDDVPILTISLSSASLDDRRLRAIANDALEHLRRVEGVSVTFIHGGRPRQISVLLDLDRMRRYSVTLLEIRRALEATNVDIPSGTLVNRNTVSTVSAGGMLRTADDVANLVVALHAHRPVYLKNVAAISDGAGEIERVHRIGYGPAYHGERPADFETGAVSIALAKRGGTNAVTVSNAVVETLDRLRGGIIPDAVTVNVTRNDGQRANDAVNTLIEHLAIAIGTVVLLLIAFLGWRAASIVTITIPLILFITLAVGMAAGQSINRITLFALILSLGLLVDDSIVVIENIYRHYAKKGVDQLRSAVQAVNEIGKPTNLATFTVILAFLPMFWVTGMMGPYMAPIPFNVPVAMLVSLAIAYTVAPWAALRWLKGKNLAHDAHAHEHMPGWLERHYVRLFTRLLDEPAARKRFFIGVSAALAIVMLMPAVSLVQFKMLPKNNTNTFNITVDMPEGTALEETDRVVRQVGDIVRQHPQVVTYESTVGEPGVIDFNGLLRGAGLKRGPNVGEVRVNLRDKHDRWTSSITIALELRKPLAQLAQDTGADIKLVEDPPGPPVRATILAELYGPDDVQGSTGAAGDRTSGAAYQQLLKIAKELRAEVFAKTGDVVDIDDSSTADVTEYRINVNREKASLAGILPAQVAEILQAFLAGYNVGTVHIEQEKEPVPIRFQIPVADRIEPADLRKIFFVNPQGVRVSLTDIADIVKVTAPKPILHKDQRPVVYVTGELATSSQVYAVLKMWNYLRNHELPGGVKLTQYFMADPETATAPTHMKGRTSEASRVSDSARGPRLDPIGDTLGYSLRWDGEMRLTLDVFRDLGAAFMVALVLIYLVLVGYYRSFATPMIVMGAIPLTLIGVLPGHAILGQYFTATSMIGVIALAGIVVRNSLLLIDFILDFRREGHELREAVIQAGATRMRPILLTAFAIILGTFIMVFDPVFGGLAVSLIFGTFASTVLTLFVIPLVYYLYEQHQHHKA